MSCTDTCLWMGEGDSGELYRESRPRAAKQHTCCECREPIAKGDVHHYAAGKWDGIFEDFRTCLACHEIRSVFACEGWAFCCLWEEVRDQMFRAWDEMTAIDCLARLKTDAAVAKMRAKYDAFVSPLRRQPSKGGKQ